MQISAVMMTCTFIPIFVDEREQIYCPTPVFDIVNTRCKIVMSVFETIMLTSKYVKILYVR